MKKIFVLFLSALILTSCDPVKKVYEDLDAVPKYNTKSATYVLSDGDYKSMATTALKKDNSPSVKYAASRLKNQHYFSEPIRPADYIPSVLEYQFPGWGRGSTIIVTYNQGLDKVEEWNALGQVHYLNVKASNLHEVGIKGNALGKNYLKDLSKIIPAMEDNAEGNTFLVNYPYSETSSNDVVFLSQDFENIPDGEPAISGWTIKSQGNKWAMRTYNGNKYIQYSAYKSKTACDAWIVTPKFTVDKNTIFTFDANVGNFTTKTLSVWISDDFEGKIDVAKWTEITSAFTFPKAPAKGYASFANAGNYSLKAFAGKSVAVAFRYVGDPRKKETTTYQIDNISVRSVDPTVAVTEIKIATALVRLEDGKVTNVNKHPIYAMTEEDYKSIGGTVGRYTSFNSSNPAKEYLPKFFSLHEPYAKDGDSHVVVYKYYDSSKKQMKAYTDRVCNKQATWMLDNRVEERSSQFVHNGTKWLFDPTIVHTLDKDDYATILAWVKENHPSYMDPKYSDQEWWFGASAHYSNFTLGAKRLTNDPDGTLEGKSSEEVLKITVDRFKESNLLVLKARYADRPAQSNGVDQYYVLSFQVYNNGARELYTYRYKGLGKAEFELVEGPMVKGI